MNVMLWRIVHLSVARPLTVARLRRHPASRWNAAATSAGESTERSSHRRRTEIASASRGRQENPGHCVRRQQELKLDTDGCPCDHLDSGRGINDDVGRHTSSSAYARRISSAALTERSTVGRESRSDSQASNRAAISSSVRPSATTSTTGSRGRSLAMRATGPCYSASWPWVRWPSRVGSVTTGRVMVEHHLHGAILISAHCGGIEPASISSLVVDLRRGEDCGIEAAVGHADLVTVGASAG